MFNRDISLLSNAQSRSISAENPTGEKNMGATMSEGTGKRAAAEAGLGAGWKISPSLIIKAGENKILADINGSGMITTIWCTGCLGRDFIFRIYWDGQENPSVETPLCDFFGCGWHGGESKVQSAFSPINSAMIAVNPAYGFNSFWPMPFRKGCVITLENRSERDSVLYYQINYELDEVPENAVYFHAYWKRTNPVPTNEEYVVLDNIRGKGHFAGVMLNVGINGQNLWWGEGEMKFFIDGDVNPTICTTGTEDYFGGAWGWSTNGRYTPYTGLYMGVHEIHEPSGGEDVQQRFSMYRWHILDPVRFESDLKVTLQDLGWRRNGRTYLARNDDMSSVSYWYQTLPTVPFQRLPDRYEMENI